MATILLIDDEDSLRSVLRLVLQDDGHEVLEAGDGRAGLEMYRQHQADLVITDLAMPEMNGLDFISEATRRFANVKIIAMTGMADWESCLAKAKALGARRTLQKPFTLEQLLQAV